MSRARAAATHSARLGPAGAWEVPRLPGVVCQDSKEPVAEGCSLALFLGDLSFLAVLLGDEDHLDDLDEEFRVARQLLVENSRGPFVGFEKREVTPLELSQEPPVHLRLAVQIRQQAGHVVHEHREAAGREVGVALLSASATRSGSAGPPCWTVS